MTKTEPPINWPENICADRHETAEKWVLHYLTDEQAQFAKAAIAVMQLTKTSDSDLNVSLNKCRKDFERCTEMYYEGDFAKYEDDTYVSDQQQDDFTMFRSGWEAAMNMGDAIAVMQLTKTSDDVSKVPVSNAEETYQWAYEDGRKECQREIISMIKNMGNASTRKDEVKND